VSLTWSPEDRERTAQYRRDAALASAHAQAESVESFLQGLRMRGTCTPITPANIGRVVQLVNKTNQFNLTTKRYTQPQVAQLIANRDVWTGVFGLSDRYGEHGIIGLLFAVPTETTATWEIDTWLISCRVLGRQFELFMADRLLDAARERGIGRIVGVYRRTARNSLAADLYMRLGFAPDGGEGERFILDVGSVLQPYTSYIEHAGDPRTSGSVQRTDDGGATFVPAELAGGSNERWNG